MNRPTRDELRAAAGKSIPDVIAPGLTVLFCGINPGLYSAWSGHHFARPGNRFWRALYEAGFTDRVLAPSEQRALLERGLGITNLVARGTATAGELSREELQAGGRAVRRKARKYAPRWLAVLGVGAYRAAFDDPEASVGRQARAIGETNVWVLPNPSGLNAHYRPAELADEFRRLRLATMVAGREPGAR